MSLSRADRPALGKRHVWRALFLLGGLAAFGLLVVFFLNWWVVRLAAGQIYSRVEDVPAEPVALVLGAGPASAYFNYRLDAAVALYRAGKVRHLLVSGDGVAADPQGSETALMREGLIQRGIPASVIIRDDAGLRTLDSVARAKNVFGLTTVIIVTQEFHLPRALYLARAWGLNAVGFVAADPGGDFYDSYLREWLARVKAVLDTNWLHTQPHSLGPPAPILPKMALASGSPNF